MVLLLLPLCCRCSWSVAVAFAVAVRLLVALLLLQLLLQLPLRRRAPALGEPHGSGSSSGCAVAQRVTAGNCAGTIQPEGAATVMGLPSVGVAEAPPGSPGFWLLQASLLLGSPLLLLLLPSASG